MTDSERQQILKMIDDGKISAEQGLTLMRELDVEPEEDIPVEEAADPDPSFIEIAPGPTAAESGGIPSAESKSDPEFDRKLKRFRRLWVIPLGLGVFITMVGAYGMYAALQGSGTGFWFFFASLPFTVGVLLVALGLSSRTSRWIYINVKQKPGESPQRIAFGFPLSLVSWGVRLAKNYAPEDKSYAANEVINALVNGANSSEPLMVDVKEEDGTHVQVYIG